MCVNCFTILRLPLYIQVACTCIVSRCTMKQDKTDVHDIRRVVDGATIPRTRPAETAPERAAPGNTSTPRDKLDYRGDAFRHPARGQRGRDDFSPVRQRWLRGRTHHSP